MEGLLWKDYWERSTMKVRKLLSQAGEALTNGHGGAEVENFDIDVNGQVPLGKELCCANSFTVQIVVLCKKLGFTAKIIILYKWLCCAKCYVVVLVEFCKIHFLI